MSFGGQTPTIIVLKEGMLALRLGPSDTLTDDVVQARISHKDEAKSSPTSMPA